jgi:triacylglycerol lipase
MSPIPVWNETRAGLEAAALLGSATWRDAGELDGQGRAVLLVPGFLAGDRSLGLMTQWLRRGGYWTRSAGIRTNANCAGATLTVLEERLEALADARGPAVLIGQSRGGSLARALATTRPDLTAGLITLGSPHLDPLAVGPLTLLSVRAVGTLGTLGIPGLISRDCIDGECCAAFHAARQAPWPGDVPYVCIYSKRDGIVDWHACLDPGAEHVEVGASHIGMAAHVGTYKAIADALRSIDPPVELPSAA